MSKLFRYVDVLRRTSFGWNLPWIGLWNYVKHCVFPYSMEVGPTTLAPIIVNLIVTDRCNLACHFCARGIPKGKGTNNWQSLEMTGDKANAILDLPIMRRALAVALTGGEPLLNQDLPEIVRSVKKRKKQCGVITNGLFLAERLEELRKSGVDEVQLSIYEHSMDKLSAILPRISRKIVINASYVLTRSFLERGGASLDDVIGLCRESGCRSLKISLCTPFDGDDSETIFDDCNAYHDLVRKHRMRTDSFKLFLPKPAKRKISSPGEKKCRLPWQRIMVNALGMGIMCCTYAPCTGGNLFFNVFSEDDKESFNSPVMTNLRKEILAEDTSFPEFCRGCQHLFGESFSSHV